MSSLSVLTTGSPHTTHSRAFLISKQVPSHRDGATATKFLREREREREKGSKGALTHVREKQDEERCCSVFPESPSEDAFWFPALNLISFHARFVLLSPWGEGDTYFPGSGRRLAHFRSQVCADDDVPRAHERPRGDEGGRSARRRRDQEYRGVRAARAGTGSGGRRRDARRGSCCGVPFQTASICATLDIWSLSSLFACPQCSSSWQRSFSSLLKFRRFTQLWRLSIRHPREPRKAHTVSTLKIRKVTFFSQNLTKSSSAGLGQPLHQEPPRPARSRVSPRCPRGAPGVSVSRVPSKEESLSLSLSLFKNVRIKTQLQATRLWAQGRAAGGSAESGAAAPRKYLLGPFGYFWILFSPPPPIRSVRSFEFFRVCILPLSARR